MVYSKNPIVKKVFFLYKYDLTCNLVYEITEVMFIKI